MLIKCFYKRDAPTATLELYSYRVYGQPKLQKPKELKGIKQYTSIDFIPKKCRCPIFLKGDDVWIHHKDLFSECMSENKDDIGLPLIARLDKYNIDNKKCKKYIYDDCWGSIVLRNEGWLVIKDLVNSFTISHRLEIRDKIICDLEDIFGFNRYELCVGEYENFFDKVINYIYNNIKGEN